MPNSPAAPPSDRLPLTFNDEHVLRVISSDGQLYIRRNHDGIVSRVESWQVASLVLDAVSLSSLIEPSRGDKRSRKGKKSADTSYEIVRWLIREKRECADCGARFEAVHFTWSPRRCDLCGSMNVGVSTRQASPDLPATLGNVGDPFISWHFIRETPNGHTWGRDHTADARALVQLMQSYERAPDGHCHLYLLLAFADTLTRGIARDGDTDAFNLLLNIGNIAQRAFRMTGDGDSARVMLDCFDRAAKWNSDPVPASLGRHSFGMAVINLLQRYTDAEAESLTGRPAIRTGAIKALRDALELVAEVRRDRFHDMPEATDKQERRIRYALADLLRTGNATEADIDESVQLFDSFDESLDPSIAPHIRVARAEAQLRKFAGAAEEEIADEKIGSALGVMGESLRDESLISSGHRGRWALSVGEAFLRLGGWREATQILESAVTYSLKDYPVHADPLRATNDAETLWRSFSALATAYANAGWWFEALSLLETFRGQALELESLDPEERLKRAEARNQKRDKSFFRMFSPDDSPTLIAAEEHALEQVQGTRFGPFHEDYELEGLSDRMLELFRQLKDESTLLVSFNVLPHIVKDNHVVSAIVAGPPVKPSRPAYSKVWPVANDVFEQFRKYTSLGPGETREAQLVELCRLIEHHLIEPLREPLEEFRCSRALIVAPSLLSNLPFEAFRGRRPVELGDALPVHVSFAPSLMFGAATRLASNRGSRKKILIVGYRGGDLRAASLEAEALTDLFGRRATYLSGEACTKRRVIDALNEDYDCLHFICHGTYDAWRPRESSMRFSDNQDADSDCLRAWEVRELVRLRARPVVTLSTCESGLTADSRSNTWQGLPGSFLAAGARCVIGTRWPVFDDVAHEFMTAFYRRLIAGTVTPLKCFHATQDVLRLDRAIEDWACFGYLGLP